MTIEDSLVAASQSSPWIDPESAYGLASSSRGDPSQAVDLAHATSGFARASTMAGTLGRQDADHQRRVWDGLDDNEQAMLRAAGYRLPAKPKHKSLFSRAVGAVGHVAGEAVGLPVHELERNVSDTLHALGAPLRTVQHAYRASALVTDLNEQQGEGRMNPGSLSEWAQAWRDSEHGERTFKPSTVNELIDQHGAGTVQLAKRLASGEKPEEIVAAAPENQRAALVNRLRSDSDLSDVVSRLQNAKLSFGRRVVGEHLLNEHPALGQKLSGAFDAVGDIAGDPVVWGGKFAKAAEVLPYIVSDGARVGEILDKPGAQRLIGAASGALNDGGAGELIRRFPKFSTIAQQLVDEGVDSPETMTEWFKGQAGLKAIFEGKVGGFAPKGMEGVIVPHASRTALLENALKTKGAELIDFAAEKRVPGTRAIRGLTRLVVPAGASIDPDSADGLRNLQRLADYALPSQRADELVSAFAAQKDRAGRFGVYKGLLSDMFDKLGVDPQVRTRFFDSMEEMHNTRAFGVGDRMAIEGQSQPVGFLENHVMDQGWTVPDFRMLRAQANRGWVLQKMYGAINADLLTRFMNTWKPASLLRIGFPVRVGGEEFVGQGLREGGLSTLRAKLAAGAVKGDDAFLARMVDSAASHLPDAVARRVETPTDLAGEVLGNRTSRAMRFVEGKLAGKRYVEAAKQIAEMAPDSLPEEISAAHTSGAGFLSDVPAVVKLTRSGVEARPAVLTPSGTFRDYMPTEGFYTHAWKARLEEFGDSRLAKTAAEHTAVGRQGQVDAVVERLKADDMGFIRKRAYRSTALPDGRLVGDGATAEEALRSWAETVVDNVNHLTSDSEGNRFGDLLQSVRAGEKIDVAKLAEIPQELRPQLISGPDMVPVYGTGKWARIQQSGFEHIGHGINWISRQPMFVHNYAEALDDTAPLKTALLDLGVGEEHAAAQVREVAWQRALNATTPFIHDPHVRSQFAEDIRNLGPFWFAQEQFFKRWAKTVAHNPAAFREAQLGMMGLRHSGIIHRDADGNEYFMYPGAGAMQQVLTKVGSLVLGRDIQLPLAVGFSGQVKFASPGTERLGLPSFGPLVAVPMDAMAKRFPELAELEQSLIGERGAGRAYWEQITPSSVSRVVHFLIDNPETSPQMHSAMLQAIQYLEASGHGLPDNASSLEREHYLDRVKGWTRVLMLNRAIFGFSVPAAPELQLDPSHLHEEFRSLLSSGVPIDQAVKEFLAAHPDATPYTVFQTKSQSGAPLPATAEAAGFINDHEDFLKTYPEAGAWFLPQSSGTFDAAAYREQLSAHLRGKKSIEGFYTDIKFAESAPDYFDTRDAKDQALAGAKGNSTRTHEINQQWATWRDQFLKMHPVFAEQLVSPDGEIRRTRALAQLRQALSDPLLPKVPQTEAIRDLTDTYSALESALAPYAGRQDRSATDFRKTAKARFVTWAHQYVLEHPEVSGLYDRVFRYEVGDTGA